jgi:endonuclease/exonuclease/phosphatase family metal-dependent hydrolase
MRIVTWNLGYWQHSSLHEEAWNYLCNDIKPDIALLQEVKPPSWVPRAALLFEEYKRGWGTALFAPSLVLHKEDFTLHPGRVAAASFALDGDVFLFVASIHAPIINGRVFPHLAEIFEELESHLAHKSIIVGGDLNSARSAEKTWPGNGHGPFFERIDTGDTWIDCCRRFNAEELQTFFRDSCKPYQDDHVFVSRDLGSRIRVCDVINNDLTRRVSDHIPLVAELDLSLDSTVTV